MNENSSASSTRRPAKLWVEKNSRGYTFGAQVEQQEGETEEQLNQRLTRHLDFLEIQYGKAPDT